jgi:anti-anti-sigma factor
MALTTPDPAAYRPRHGTPSAATPRMAHRLDRGALVLTVQGELDVAALALIEPALGLICAGVTHLCLDLTGVAFMDSGGLRFLAAVRAHCVREAVAFEVVGINPQHTRVLRALYAQALPATRAGCIATHAPTEPAFVNEGQPSPLGPARGKRADAEAGGRSAVVHALRAGPGAAASRKSEIKG